MGGKRKQLKGMYIASESEGGTQSAKETDRQKQTEREKENQTK